MKMTKELKKILLESFDELLNGVWTSESFAVELEHNGNKKGAYYWRKKRKNYQDIIIKGIEGLIEEEEKEEL